MAGEWFIDQTDYKQQMTNNLTNQNLRLLQAVHCEISFLKKFSPDHLSQLATKSHFFVFSPATVIAQQKEPIDFLGVILEGKVSVSGDAEKKGAGFVIGELGFCGILDRHAVSVIGDSDGIVMALRFEDINKMDKSIKAIINSYMVGRSLQILRNSENEVAFIVEQIQQRRVSHLFTQPLKILLNDSLDPKEKQALLKYFPILQIPSKMKIIDKKEEPFLLILIKGELVIKSQNPLQTIPVKILPGQIYNCEGFLLNYSPCVNVYCLSEEAVLIKIQRRQIENLIDVSTVQKIDNFLLRKEINDKKYEVVTSELRREREKQTIKTGNLSNKWSIFTKKNYEIIPLSLPKKQEKEKPKNSGQTHKEQKTTMSTLFREQLQQSKNQKTASSANSKINKVITMKTQKAEEKSNSLEQQVKDMRKQMEMMGSKIKYYEDNYTKCQLEMIEYKARYQMGAVLKEINELGDKKFRNKNGSDPAKVMTLKKAFEQHMKENRIMEVVARCAYRWLWAVRKKKGLTKLRSTLK